MRTLPAVIHRFVDFYAKLDSQSTSRLDVLYAEDAVLVDPFGEHQGLLAIQQYFTHLLTNVGDCRFAIDSPLCEGERFVVTWTMHWSHPRLAAGKILTLAGCSTIELHNTLIVRQRDYYDAGEMLYEHLPLLGWAIRSVKRRIRA